MYAMQYEVPLPADYDMQIVRDRVARTGRLMDGFPGLRFKAFVIREKAAGAPANAYAPFYVWDDVAGMRAFLWGEPGYSAIVRDFGRRPVQDWTVVDVVAGPVPLDEARSLTTTSVPLPDGVAPSQVVPGLARELLDAATATTACRVAAVDITTWSLLLVELGADTPAPPPGGAAYEVLHVSRGPRP